MSIIRTYRGPESKHDPRLPYTYEARVNTLGNLGSQEELLYYYSDTLCGLIEYLDQQQYAPGDVSLFALFQDEELALDPGPMTRAGAWLRRPALCQSLEQHYQATGQKAYIGHEKNSDCSYTDRDREVI